MIPGAALPFARKYVELGWHPIPCRERDKRPSCEWKEYQDRTATDDELVSWFGNGQQRNIGVVTGTKFFVLDVDDPHALDDREVPVTVSAKTARGMHLYFKMPHGIELRNAVKVNGRHLDIRARGGFVVCPPSIHETGTAYSWINSPLTTEIAPPPQWLLDELKKDNGDNGQERQSEPIGDEIPQGKRNATLTSLAGSMRRRGAGQAAIRAALHETNRSQCNPPLPDAEVHRIAQSVGRYEPDEQKKTEQKRFFVESYPQFGTRVERMPEPRTLINELLYEDSITLKHGQPRTRKTLAAMEEALALVTGTPAFGLERFDVPEPVPVWYVMEEDPQRRMLQRLDWLRTGRGLTERPELLFLSVRNSIDLDDEEWQHALIKAARHFGIRYTILDPFRAMTEGADGTPKDLRPFARFIRDYVKTTGSAVGIVHHDTKPLVGKEDTRKRPQKASGGGIYSICDAPIHAEEIDASRTLYAPCGYKFAEDPKPFVATFETVGDPIISARLVGEDTEESKAKGLVLREKIKRYLTDNPWASISAISAGIQSRKENVTAMLEQLKSERTIEEKPGKRGARTWANLD